MPNHKRRDICFLPHKCAYCGSYLNLKKEYVSIYERRGYPTYHKGCQQYGDNNVMRRPEISEKLSLHHKTHINLKFQEYLKIDHPMHNPEILAKWHSTYEKNHTEIKIEIRPVILSEQEKCRIAIERLENRRLERIEKEKLEEDNKPKLIEKTGHRFGMLMCIIDGRLIKCKKPKQFCSHWDFCHRGKNVHS